MIVSAGLFYIFIGYFIKYYFFRILLNLVQIIFHECRMLFRLVIFRKINKINKNPKIITSMNEDMM